MIASDDPGRARDLADRAAQVASVIGHVRALLAQGIVALSAGSTELARAKAMKAADVARSRQDLPGLAEAMELEAATLIDETRARSLLEQARRVWEEIDAPIGLARVDMALAGCPVEAPISPRHRQRPCSNWGRKVSPSRRKGSPRASRSALRTM